MDRHTLEKLYAASQGHPTRIFKRALSEDPTDAIAFLAEHVDELEADVLSGVFAERLEPELEMLFVRRLATLVERNVRASLPSDDALTDLLELSDKIGADAWLELTTSLKEKIPSRLWYRFVGNVRGCELFDAINDLKPLRNDGIIPRLRFKYDDAKRREPIVVGALDRPHDKLAVAKHALKAVPVLELRRLHERFPSLITRDDIHATARERVMSKDPPEASAPQDGEVLPECLAPFCVERLGGCDDDEARVLCAWLHTLPPNWLGNITFESALERFKVAARASRATEMEWWSVCIGRHLSTGSAWKTKGREFIGLCIDLKWFSSGALRAALRVAKQTNGVSQEKHGASILKHAHDETAKLLIERTDGALKAGDFKEGDLLLSAFMSLDPGSFASPRLHRLLTNHSSLPPAIVARIEACKELASAGGREPSERDLREAFLVLTGHMQ